VLWVAQARCPGTGGTGPSGGFGGLAAPGQPQPPRRYVLDFLAERKSVQDLVLSIAGTRYVGQKAAMAASGLGRLLYLVEGSPEGLPDGAVGCWLLC
jgi:hypothetical protein